MLISPNFKKIHTLFESRGYKPNDEVDPDHSNITLDQLKAICAMPLWYKDKEVHKEQAKKHPDRCCFHHFLGLEQKYGEYKTPHAGLLKAMQDWNTYKANVIWKFGGMAATTTGEYFLPHKAIAGFGENIVNSEMGLVVGPKMRLATKMLDSIREKFRRKQGIEFAENSSILQFPPPNRVKLEIYPSNVHVSAIRSIKNMSWIWFDECDFISKNQVFEMLDALERYILKSRAHVILVSTPNRPDHMLDTIARHYPDVYHIEKYDVWTWGIPHCYTMEEVMEAKKRRSFPREFECKFLGNEGNVYMKGEIDYAFNTGLEKLKLHRAVLPYWPNQYDHKDLEKIDVINYLDPWYYQPVFPKTMGIDPASGSSRFSITITAVVDNKIVVLYSKHFRRHSESEMIPLIKLLAAIYRNIKIVVDGNAASVVQALKAEFKEQTPDRMYPNVTNIYERELYDSQTVIPLNFRAAREQILQHNHALVAHRLVWIHPIFNDLHISMESAEAKGWDLDKDKTVFDDQLDSFCMATSNHMYEPVTEVSGILR